MDIIDREINYGKRVFFFFLFERTSSGLKGNF